MAKLINARTLTVEKEIRELDSAIKAMINIMLHHVKSDEEFDLVVEGIKGLRLSGGGCPRGFAVDAG